MNFNSYLTRLKIKFATIKSILNQLRSSVIFYLKGASQKKFYENAKNKNRIFPL